MNKTLIGVVVGVVLLGAGGYVFVNFRNAAEVEVVDQSGLDEEKLIEAIGQNNALASDTGQEPNYPVDESTVTESPTTSGVSLLKTGGFNRIDAVHYANGKANIYQTGDGPVLKLEGFETNNGPDLFVYLSTTAEVSAINTDLGEVVSLGELKKIRGDQVYALPDDFDRYSSVVIWCRAFNINFSAASLI